jgi:hypothetical protein
MVAAAAVVALAGCGTSAPRLSPHDEASFTRINGLVATFQGLEGQVATGTVAGSKVNGLAEYARIERPRIKRLDKAARQLRLVVGSLDDRKAAALYTPLAKALDQEARDFESLLTSVTRGDLKGVRRVYAHLDQDRHRINQVAREQLPKVQAYAKTLDR